MPDDRLQELQNELATLREHQAAERERETQWGKKLTAKEVEFQALRARAELDSYRQQLRIGDLEKLLTLRESEIAKLRPLLEALMAEHAECAKRQGSGPEGSNAALVAQLSAELESARRESDELKQAIDSSLALKLARSAPRLLGPFRALLGKGAR